MSIGSFKVWKVSFMATNNVSFSRPAEIRCFENSAAVRNATVYDAERAKCLIPITPNPLIELTEALYEFQKSLH